MDELESPIKAIGGGVAMRAPHIMTLDFSTALKTPSNNLTKRPLDGLMPNIDALV